MDLEAACAVHTRSMDENVGSWLSTTSLTDMAHNQLSDSILGKFIRLKQSNQNTGKPPWKMVAGESRAFKALFQQWDVVTVEDGVLYRQKDADKPKQMVIPANQKTELLVMLHDGPTGGHMGVARTYDSVKHRFYWVGMKRDIQAWCKRCRGCAQRKPGPEVCHAPLQSTPSGDRNARIAFDIVGPLPVTDRGNAYILVIGCYFTKFMEAFALPNHTATTIADTVTVEWIARYGVPDQIHSDQAPVFNSKLIAGICNLLGVQKTRTCPYRPQSDGFIERFNRTMQNMLSILGTEDPSDWDERLPFVMMAYRAGSHASTGFSPNLMMFGAENRLPVDLVYPLPREVVPQCPEHYVLWLRKCMQEAHELARKQLSIRHASQKRTYDKNVKFVKFLVNDMVWRWHPPSARVKLGLGWIGPYKVIEVRAPIHYLIENEKKNTSLVHVDHLKPYY